MGKYFGTDGIRGEANVRLNVDIALKVGQYLGYVNRGSKIVVGQDTRLSSSMFASAIAAGASSMGADVYLLGVCATPALAHLVKMDGFGAGVMISASHNPFLDNGLKCFASTGMKISNELENEIEAFIDGEVELDYAKSDAIGRVYDYPEGINHYLEHIESIVETPLTGLKIILDCANGSAVSSAQRAFEDLGANVVVMHHDPDGYNINTECGSTHPESLMREVARRGFDMGFAFDGDADRCLAVDHEGNLVDGDGILYILGKDLKRRGILKENTVVSTVMANLGFMHAMKEADINVVSTDVGDKHVFASMVENDYSLGGEQSGHIILKDFVTTGDGVLTALILAEIAALSQKSLKDLLEGFERFPQVLENIHVSDKVAVMNHPAVLEAVKKIESVLKDDGRILVRSSGTEELVRIMVEAKSIDLCQVHVNDMINVVKNIG